MEPHKERRVAEVREEGRGFPNQLSFSSANRCQCCRYLSLQRQAGDLSPFRHWWPRSAACRIETVARDGKRIGRGLFSRESARPFSG